jgi:hypothetical protein
LIASRRRAIGRAAAALVIAALVVAAAFGYAVLSLSSAGSNNPAPAGTTSSEARTSSIALVSVVTVTAGASGVCTSYSTNTTTAAGVNYGDLGGAALQVVSENGSPIAGVEITGQTVAQCEITGVWQAVTNYTGWIREGEGLGAYNLTFTYSGHVYNVGTPTYPASLTVIRVQVPSGFWTLDVRAFGGYPGEPISGPVDLTSGTTGTSPFRLEISLGNSSVKEGQQLPIEVSFVGLGASNASYPWVTVVATNSQGTVVSNFSGRQPNLYFLGGRAATGLLRGFSSDNDWNANPHPPEFTVPVTPGNYTVTVTSIVGGRTLMASDVVQVVS